MSYQIIVWKSRLRPTLKRIGHRIWPFMHDAQGFALAPLLGWTLAWFSFGGFDRIFWTPFLFVMVAGPFGIMVAAVYRLLTQDDDRHFRRTLGIVAGLFFSGFVALHFVRYSPKSLAFLGEAPVTFMMASRLGDAMEATYTFRANHSDVVEKATPELVAEGYKAVVQHGVWEADKGASYERFGSRFEIPYHVSIWQGRAVGTRSGTRGERLGTEPQSGWVTVAVVQPELIPFGLAVLFP